MPDMIVLVATAVGFSVVNGMNDISAVIAPLIATRAMTVRSAHLVALCGIVLGILFAHAAVAQTVAFGLVDLGPADPARTMDAWIGAIGGALAWGVLARRFGIPTSATHAFIGALCGATLAATRQPALVHWGFDALADARIEGVMKVAAGLVLSPLVGSLLGFVLFHTLIATLKSATAPVHDVIKNTQRAVLLWQTFCYGSNDAQTVMGAVTAATLLSPHDGFQIPLWIKIVNLAALSTGVLLGSANILRTMGGGLIQLTTAEAACGQIGEAASVLGAAWLGAPVSSTQVLSSALVGAGGANRPRHVRWKRVREIVLTWLLTAPCAALLGALIAGILGGLR